jgi:arylsulfatase A-like enzyme
LTRVLFRITVALLAGLSILVTSPSARATDVSPAGGDPRFVPLAQAQYLVLIVLDGARPDYFGVTPLPHVDALRAQGTQYTNAIAGILESETPSGHTTISTGTTPRHNGILGFSWAENDSYYSLFSPTIVRSGAMERIMADAHVPTIAGLFKARYPKATVVALSGHKYYAADPLGGPQADAIMYFSVDATKQYRPTAIPGHVPPYGVLEAPGLSVPDYGGAYGRGNSLTTKLALSAFAVMRQRVTLINYADFDWPLGHVDGGNLAPGKVISLMQTFDQDLGQIEDAYRKAGVLKKTLFVITADHGMAPLQRFIPQTVFTNAVAQAGTSTDATTFATAAYLWLRNPARAGVAAANIIRVHDPGIQSVYYWDGSKARYVRTSGSVLSAKTDAANQYLLRTMVNGHEPNIVAFTRRGNSAQNPTTRWKADHGGAGWQAQHIPLILSGPGIRSGKVSAAPAQLDDIAPTALSDLGVAPAGMEGQVLTDALKRPLKSDQPGRRAEINQVTPVVDALVAQDATEAAGR